MSTAGIVLCGGRSSRMGSPKAWLRFGEEYLLQRVVQRVREAVDHVLVVAARDQSLPPINAEIIRDEADYLGPLHGLARGLRSVRSDCDRIYLSACDMPHVCPPLIRTLLSALDSAEVAMPRVAGMLQPLAGAYRVTVLPTVEQKLNEGRLRLLDLVDLHPTSWLDEAKLAELDPTFMFARNINTPEELAESTRG